MKGIVIGPLFFILYVNDITEFIDKNCDLRLYVDVFEMYSVILGMYDLDTMEDILHSTESSPAPGSLQFCVGNVKSFTVANITCLIYQH